MAIIPLAPSLLTGSSSLPGDLGRAVRNISLFGLAPCGVLPAIRVATNAVRSYRTFSPLPFDSALRTSLRASLALSLRGPASSEARRAESRGGMFSVPLSFGSPRPAVNRRTALRSSDFPPTFARLRELRRTITCFSAALLLWQLPASGFRLSANRRPLRRSRTAPASCTGCCAACRSLRRSWKCSRRSRAASRPGISARRIP